MPESIYVITYHQFNHDLNRPRAHPFDERFLHSSRNYFYYLIDREVPKIFANKQVIQECDLDPLLHEAGGKHLGEWSFLLAEEKHSFCQYPFFMISSRFYEKNRWLRTDLNDQWDALFGLFSHYRFGFLPSYDRPLRWLDLDWKTKLKKKVWRYSFFPWKEPAFALTKQLLGTRIPEEYRYVSDLQCNYIGFRDRQALLDYVRFYRPLIEYFFDDAYRLLRSVDPYVRQTGAFRNEKPLTFLLEILSHLFFFSYEEKVFALHYDGYYEIDERKTELKKLYDHSPSWFLQCEQMFRWHWRRLKTEGYLAPLYAKIHTLYKSSS